MEPLSITRPPALRWSEAILLGLLLEPAIRAWSYGQGVLFTLICWLILILPALLILSTTRSGRESSRTVLLVLAVGGVAMAIFSGDLFAFGEPEREIASATSIPNLIGVGLLYTPSASAWFKARQTAPAETSPKPSGEPLRGAEKKGLLSPEQLRSAAKRLADLAETQTESERRAKILTDAKNLEIVAKVKESRLKKASDAVSRDSDVVEPEMERRTRSEAPVEDVRGDQNDRLRKIFEQSSQPFREPIRDQLAYRHMIALADAFEGWAMDARITPEQTASLVGKAESLRRLADEVGPSWDPPTPERLTLLGFLGRKTAGE